MGAVELPGRWPRHRARGPVRFTNAVVPCGAAYRSELVVPAKSVPFAATRKVLNAVGARMVKGGSLSVSPSSEVMAMASVPAAVLIRRR